MVSDPIPGVAVNDPLAGQRAPDLEVGWQCPRCGGYNGAVSGEYPRQCTRCTWAPSLNTVRGVASVTANLSGVALNDLLRRQYHDYQRTLPDDPSDRSARGHSSPRPRANASRSRDQSESRRRTRRRVSDTPRVLSNSELSNRGVNVDLDMCDQELLYVLRRINNDPHDGFRKFFQDCLAQPKQIRDELTRKGRSMLDSPDGQVRCGGFINTLVSSRQAWKAEVQGVARSHQKWKCQCGQWSFMDWDVCSWCAALLENSCIEHPWQSPPPGLQPPAQRSSGSSGSEAPAWPRLD